jgi:hypothetical protein
VVKEDNLWRRAARISQSSLEAGAYKTLLIVRK